METTEAMYDFKHLDENYAYLGGLLWDGEKLMEDSHNVESPNLSLAIRVP